ncbi:hypothetical protein PRUPE_5G008800 [Prunus persica]|uniref:Galactose oxidase/kelch repeat superfamily protein n=1 Tax=Prunus persica TaxID=3760 RepID=A0A251P1N1_PRUPE|nr:hypothetical protein PRUPE_5G008800 [Prunus persica]
MIADSKSYIVGGRFPLQPPNLEVFACEPNPDDPEGLCKSNLPALSGPKLDPFVFTIEGKIYVLATEYRGGPVEEKSLALFEVFNPISGSWKVLPNPPFIFGHRGFPNIFANDWHVWGHKILISN